MEFVSVKVNNCLYSLKKLFVLSYTTSIVVVMFKEVCRPVIVEKPLCWPVKHCSALRSNVVCHPCLVDVFDNEIGQGQPNGYQHQYDGEYDGLFPI